MAKKKEQEAGRDFADEIGDKVLNDVESLPKNANTYLNFVIWRTLPSFLANAEEEDLRNKGFSEDLIELTKVKDQKAFANKFGVTMTTLSRWKKKPRFQGDVNHVLRWSIHSIYGAAVDHSFARTVVHKPTPENVKLFKQLYAGYDKNLSPPDDKVGDDQYESEVGVPNTAVQYLMQEMGIDPRMMKNSPYAKLNSGEEVSDEDYVLPSEQSYDIEDVEAKSADENEEVEDDGGYSQEDIEKLREKAKEGADKAEEKEEQSDRRRRVREAMKKRREEKAKGKGDGSDDQ